MIILNDLFKKSKQLPGLKKTFGKYTIVCIMILVHLFVNASIINMLMINRRIQLCCALKGFKFERKNLTHFFSVSEYQTSSIR